MHQRRRFFDFPLQVFLIREAAAIENENKFCVDVFQFSYFPIIWPSAIQGEGTGSLSEVKLSVDQILELREYYRHRLSLPLDQKINMTFWLRFFSLHSTCNGQSFVLRNLAMRRVPGEHGGGDIVRDQIRQYFQTPAKHMEMPNSQAEQHLILIDDGQKGHVESVA